MEHACHLCACHFVEAINPTPVHMIKWKLFENHQATHSATMLSGGFGDDYDDHENYFNDDNMDNSIEVENDNAEADYKEDKEADLVLGDIVGKALALVTQVSTFQHLLFSVYSDNTWWCS